MKTLILEDETLAAKDLLKTIEQLTTPIEVLGVLKTVKAAQTWLAENPEPELILADIQLADASSFDLFEHANIQCPIIFTTAYDEFALRAFKLNSIDYLLKPIDIDQLAYALHKYSKLQNSQALTSQIQTLIANFHQTPRYKERFLVLSRNALVPLQVTDIAYFIKDELIFAVTYEGKRHVCDMHSLEEVEKLVDPQLFYRANRQFIIHSEAVAKIKTTHKGLTVELKSGLNQAVAISREKAKSFKQWMT
ncbi:MAG: LytR/AlgR family response regulator transcription factor [Flammeovirgaceae bacterium]